MALTLPYLSNTDHYNLTCISFLPTQKNSSKPILLHHIQQKIYPDGVGEIALVPLHTNTGRAIHRLKGHMGAVTAVMYRKRYNQVISTGKDGMIFLWDTSVSDALDDERMELAARFNARWVSQQYPR